MPICYSSADGLEHGVPLGGIGCGALEVFPDGTRGRFTGLNNWQDPLGQLHWFRRGSAADYRVANPFAIFVQQGERRLARLLQTQPVAGLPTVRRLRMEADFPIVELVVDDPELGVDVSATIFSGLLPGRYQASGLPGVVYRWRIRNPGPSPVVVALLCCAVNPVGTWNVSRYNTVVRRDGLVGVVFRRRHARPDDVRHGTVALLTDPRGGTVSYWGSWMYAGAPFSGEQTDRRIAAWEPFARDGRLPNDATVREAFGELDEPMGALAIRATLPPGGTRDWPVVYTWHMPRQYLGHYYARRYPSAWAVGRHLHRTQRRLLERIRAWHRIIRQAPWPSWLSDGLINSLCVYSGASWWTRRGAFAIVENPVKWPLMDSLDVRYYGTLALALLFPALERSTMELFRAHQRSDGRIPHDLGKAQLNCPSDGTTAGPAWKDLSTKYALMVLRDALWNGDWRWARRLYPSVKRAMRWQLATDTDQDGLPENEGLDSTYDLWHFVGAGSYTAGLHLAALRATEALARMAGDPAFARHCRQLFARAARSFDEQLWTGSYYRAARQPDGTTYDACIAGQLNGQWYAHLLGLGYLLPRGRVRQAVSTMLRLNGSASRFGAVNAVMPDGRPDTRSYHSANIWVGETYALAALAIYEGEVVEGLRLAHRMWRTFVEHAKRPWSQTDVVAAQDGQLGDGEFYLRNVAIWAIPLALARRDAGARRVLRALVPRAQLWVKGGHPPPRLAVQTAMAAG
jgi:uncharacterized protein (DUF608 family)